MPLDVSYTNGYNTLSSSTGSYEWTTAATPRIERSIMAWYRVIDGVGFGNRAWAELERGSNTSEDRERLRRFTREAIQWAIDSKLITPPEGETEVIVEVDDVYGVPHGTHTAGVRVAYHDVPAGKDDEVLTRPPWGV